MKGQRKRNLRRKIKTKPLQSSTQKPQKEEIFTRVLRRRIPLSTKQPQEQPDQDQLLAASHTWTILLKL